MSTETRAWLAVLMCAVVSVLLPTSGQSSTPRYGTEDASPAALAAYNSASALATRPLTEQEVESIRGNYLAEAKYLIVACRLAWDAVRYPPPFAEPAPRTPLSKALNSLLERMGTSHSRPSVREIQALTSSHGVYAGFALQIASQSAEPSELASAWSGEPDLLAGVRRSMLHRFLVWCEPRGASSQELVARSIEKKNLQMEITVLCAQSSGAAGLAELWTRVSSPSVGALPADSKRRLALVAYVTMRAAGDTRAQMLPVSLLGPNKNWSDFDGQLLSQRHPERQDLRFTEASLFETWTNSAPRR